MCAADLPTFARPEAPAGRIELSQGWQLASARKVTADGAALSAPGEQGHGWHDVAHMPATVLQALQDDGTFPDLYVGENLADVPADLYRQDWWYRTTFHAPAGRSSYRLDFPGINYRAEVWLNGHLIADSSDVVGMYVSHELDVSRWINTGADNTLAVKVTPEQALQDVDGVELADSWWDWINWNRIGYQGPGKDPQRGNSFVADRNAGIWKPVYLSYSGAAVLDDPMVTTELPLPETDRARLTVYTDVRNASAEDLRGVVRATISRAGKPDISVDQPVRLAGGERREIRFDPDTFEALTVADPDLWWPYTMGEPNLYDLRVEFRQYGTATATDHSRFGIRTVTQHRDRDEQFPELGRGGNFYLTVNGRDFLVRGAAYTPDLLFRYDPSREDAILGYVRDLGLNMLRLEGKFPGENIIERADELGIPLMYGWMCCNQWEKWWQWDDEDRRISTDSLRSTILSLRGHPSAFIWANGSDGKPPPAVSDAYHGILDGLHWPNSVVDTVSSMARGEDGERDWDGIHMAGPYTWRPPSYWFSGRYAATRGSNAEQGDNEHIPPFASLKKFIPPDKLWPINDAWYFHAGANPSNAKLDSIRTAVVQRYGTSQDAEEFAGKAQLAHYESTRAQFEAFAATGWANHKMTIYWMLNNHWPSFFGHLFDYYLRPGGAYYGAKKGLRPLSVVFDSYATGDHDTANVTVVNQSPEVQRDLTVRVRTYDLAGRVRDDRSSGPLTAPSGGAVAALTLPRQARDSPVFFVRCELIDAKGEVVAANTYWQSQQRDDVGSPGNDRAFDLTQTRWADMTPLNTMARVPLQVSAERSAGTDSTGVVIRLHNPTRQIGFFERAEITSTRDGDEILPIEYSDNYVTVYPGETVELTGQIAGTAPAANWVRVTGYNSAPVAVPIDEPSRR
ncbi:glycoside hydrolase [Mycobacterium sp. 21AC1]|uniref:glycoside hydrolase family 2 protein n=1 Tax=[Mycobacterium] appelbergii TaxID=2939269 RepID=UPI002939489F|nr:sugar-binding domain-containing protein [Mycobacterium sp. 21AC1]MDV3126372.1 glycoside hydrolase [Mycobacterium sp. 21AC1]